MLYFVAGLSEDPVLPFLEDSFYRALLDDWVSLFCPRILVSHSDTFYCGNCTLYCNHTREKFYIIVTYMPSMSITLYPINISFFKRVLYRNSLTKGGAPSQRGYCNGQNT